MSYYQCAVCSLPFQGHIASVYCSERCYIVDGMAFYYQSLADTNQPSTTTPTSNWSSWTCSSSSSSPASESDIYHTTLSTVRKNKTLPPPTLSPILMPTLPTPSQPTRLTATSSTGTTRSRSSSLVSASSWHSGDSMNTSVNSSYGGEEDPLSGNWPKMVAARRLGHFGSSSSSSSFDQQLDSNGQAQWDPISMGWTSTTTATDATTSSQPRSELPLPSSYLLHAESAWENEEQILSPPSAWSMSSSSSPRKYLALSASIWGPGWHQVEPLPPSFVKTLEQSELELQAQVQALALEKAALAAANPKAIAKKAKREAKAAAAAAAAALAAATAQEQGDGQSQDAVMGDAESCQASTSLSSPDVSTAAPLNALCCSRLPRSLQFVD